ncbi:uncharacterized protein LOC111351402 [Spodoptera litura]|uniref:Uncharacterized protein LOC111351402 n=1 Tax=Spodoptera litura TaxID=69820 RepID=A0A9J7DZZ3_SPOLT|nr:uncharacterized protein LOC111351402 [Spodoptera litura]
MNVKEYKKRAGTSGIQGQLYETKLTSLINFRALHNDTTESFHLASNIDEIGTFDDICLRIKVSEFDKPLAIFIQAKHRENDKLFTFSNKNDLAKYFDSYFRIRQLFSPANKSPIFGGKYEDVECFFVMYTTAKDDNRTEVHEGEFADYLNEFIGTGEPCLQPVYEDDHLDFLCKIVIKEEIVCLAQNIAKFITEQSNTELSMNNDLILRYHVLLAKEVFEVTEIQTEGHRFVHFREDFFGSINEFIVLFKNLLCLDILKKNRSEMNDDKMDNIDSILSKFLAEPKEELLSKLIGNVITYKNNKLEFIHKSTNDELKRKLDKLNVPQTVVFNAAVIEAKEYLQGLKLKVPAFFGNKDLAIRGNDAKIDKRLTHLTTKFVEIFENGKTDNVITIDESLGDGFLQLNGGLSSAVGNILVFDDDTRLLKFTDDFESLGSIAKRWYERLTIKIDNLNEYRLDVKVKKFPKLSFERGEYDVSLVRDFYDRLLFFTDQSDQSGVEDILKKEIEDHPCNDAHNFRVRSDVIFLRYHDEIQKLWMTPKKGSYLTKKSKIYENAVTNAMSEPLIGVLNTMHRIKNKDYVFKEVSLKIFAESDVTGSVIASGSPVLTAVKLEQYLGKKDHTVLDLEYIFKLPVKSHTIFCKELTNCKDKILIILSNKIQNFRSYNKKLESIAKAVNGKPIIIVVDKPLVKTIKEYFSQVNAIVNDDPNSLIDLTDESQKKVLGAAKAKFQGLYVNLDMIIDEESAKLIDENILNNIIDGKLIKIGNKIIDYSYKKNKEFYIDRIVSRNEKLEEEVLEVKEVMTQTLYDLHDDVVLITALPGMGKSTLMTHLSLKTKEVNPKLWILRINLLEHTKALSDWKDGGTDINMLESLRFICDVAICKDHEDCNEDDEFKIELEEVLGTVILKNGHEDSLIEFQLQLFLYYYNTKELIFIFDGFDEIFPHYADQALALVKSVRDFTRKHKIWITSRSFNDIKLILEAEFGLSYEIEHFTRLEQDSYLFTYWQSKLQFKKLNSDQLQNVNSFVQFIQKHVPTGDFCLHSKIQHTPYFKVYLNFLEYLKKQSIDTGIKFSYDEYNNHMLKFDSRKSVISYFTNDLIAPPLHLYLLAEYFLNKIKNVDQHENKWDFYITGYIFYEYYMETKLKRIRFQEKNKIDVYKPDNKVAYEKERVECIDKHKKLGAYAIFYPNTDIFEEAELQEMRTMIDELKDGRDKTGLIRTVADNIPIFVHMSFAEYFAVEYICDQLKSQDTEEKQEKIWKFIIKVMFCQCDMNIFDIFNTKFKMDSQLIEIAERNKQMIRQLMYELKNFGMVTRWSDYERIDKISRGIDYRYTDRCLLLTVTYSTLLDNGQIDENSCLDFEKFFQFYYLVNEESGLMAVKV